MLKLEIKRRKKSIYIMNSTFTKNGFQVLTLSIREKSRRNIHEDAYKS